MPNPSIGDQGDQAQNIETTSSILAPQSSRRQAPQARSPQIAKPTHAEQVTLQTWTRENSLKLDRWLWYIEQEFELLGGVR